MTEDSFAHIGISCKDMLVTEKFYTKHFGFRRARVIHIGNDQIIFLKRDSDNLYLEMFKSTEDVDNVTGTKDGPNSPGFKHLAFKVDSVDKTLEQMGDDAKITQGPMNFDAFIPGWRAVWLSDPDGRIVEISQGYVDENNPEPVTL